MCNLPKEMLFKVGVYWVSNFILINYNIYIYVHKVSLEVCCCSIQSDMVLPQLSKVLLAMTFMLPNLMETYLPFFFFFNQMSKTFGTRWLFCSIMNFLGFSFKLCSVFPYILLPENPTKTVHSRQLNTIKQLRD